MKKFSYIIVTVFAVLMMSVVSGQAQDAHGGGGRGGRNARSSTRGGSIGRSFGGGRYYGGRYGGWGGVGLGLGLWGLGYPYYYGYPYYPNYIAPIVVDQPSTSVYVQPDIQQPDPQQDPQQIDPQQAYPQQQAVPPQPSQTNYWYYCQNPQGYYPYVKQCSTGWMKVVPTPPPGQ